MIIGQKCWVIPEGYIPGWSHGGAHDLQSHDEFCILNAADKPAHLTITIYFEDRDPVGPYCYVIGPQRTKHIRVNGMNDPEPIPHETPYSSIIVADRPIVVQYTRLDSRQTENALLSTIAYPVEQSLAHNK